MIYWILAGVAVGILYVTIRSIDNEPDYDNYRSTGMYRSSYPHGIDASPDNEDIC